jgi:hypothetical protein
VGRVEGLRDRQNKVWRPLLAIAALAGRDWAARARRAAVALAAGETSDEPRSACSCSAGGYGVWLAYGLTIRSIPLIVVDAIGLVCGGVTLALALHLRGSLLAPSTWSCPSSPDRKSTPEATTTAACAI